MSSSEHSVEDMLIMSKTSCKNKILFNYTLLCRYYVYLRDINNKKLP